MRHKVVLFDIDFTLCTSGGAGRRALEGAVRDVTGLHADLSRVPFAGRTDPAIVRDLLGLVSVEPSSDLLARVFERYVARLDREVGDGSACALLPGARETVEALSGHPHVHLGLLTGNIARGAEIKLRPFGIATRFAFGAYGDDAATRPDLLPVALERWRAVRGNGTECAMRDLYVIGDTVHDVAVARAHGARAVAVGTGRQQLREELLATAPDFFFEDLRAAAPMLREILET